MSYTIWVGFKLRFSMFMGPQIVKKIPYLL